MIGQDDEIRILINNLVVAYGKTVALNISSVDVKGRTFAVVGHNGSGKSTLIKVLLGLLSPRKGNINVCVENSTDSITVYPEEKMAFSPEEGAIFADLTVESYLRLWCRIKCGDSKYYRLEGSKYIDLFDLGPMLPKLGRELSKGQRRRVQTAIGFISDPSVFFFDEPFDGLDVEQTSRLSQIIQKESSNRAIFISSHRMEIVERLCDIVIVLEHGQVSALGQPAEVAKILCPTGFVLNIKDSEARGIVNKLAARFPSSVCYETHAGGYVCGLKNGESDLKQFLNELGDNRVSFESSTVSLVDAMHLQLKNHCRPA